MILLYFTAVILGGRLLFFDLLPNGNRLWFWWKLQLLAVEVCVCVRAGVRGRVCVLDPLTSQSIISLACLNRSCGFFILCCFFSNTTLVEFFLFLLLLPLFLNIIQSTATSSRSVPLLTTDQPKHVRFRFSTCTGEGSIWKLLLDISVHFSSLDPSAAEKVAQFIF